MLAAALTHALEPIAELHALDGVDAHQPFGDLAFELVEHGLAESDRHARRDQVDARADRVAGSTQLVEKHLELRQLVGIGAEERGQAEAIARNPSASADIRGVLILGLVLIESLVIYVLLISLILFFLKPFA